MLHRIFAFVGLSATAFGGSAVAQERPAEANHPVLELRQYKLTTGSHARFIALFDREFVDSQEALGIQMVGQFQDHDRPERFTWIRGFPNMAERQRSLQAFYTGPVWMQHRTTANPMLDDNDNVLLLRPARAGAGFGATAHRPGVGASNPKSKTYFAVIEYLWKDPNEGFSTFFLDEMSPLLAKAGLPVLGVYVPEEQPNNFPRLPVRSDKRLLVWFTSSATSSGYEVARSKLTASKAWNDRVATRLADAEEREPQVLRLDPTPRSALR